ncbi:NTP pyrophosphohydrolase [Actinopolymorpha sp. NPDC004070]|uniref:NTP pyrophosphohydrolase n=1 Tax=Actinopolymorpha sp. NPDC004070 TaxID=3154548 RepID=UPI0033BA7BFD
MSADLPTLVVVDAANVMGSVPDGWWRDRSGAAARVRDALADVAAAGLPGVVDPPAEVVLVTEGAARDVPDTPSVRVVPARGSGDDAIVDLVRSAGPDRRRVVVVTADRGLRNRVQALGAEVVGPRTVYPR